MKTAKEKLEKPIKEGPKIVKIPKKMEKRFGKGKLLIHNPLDIKTLIKKVKKGNLITFGQRNLPKNLKLGYVSYHHRNFY